MSPPIIRIATIALSAGVLVAGCAPVNEQASAASAGARSCFLPRQVDSFAPQGITVVNLRHNQEYYRLNLAENCPEIQESDAIRVIPRGVGSFVCVGETANAEVLAVSKVVGPKRCLVHDVQKLTPTEVASLSKKEKP
jgi:hypothetical protein